MTVLLTVTHLGEIYKLTGTFPIIIILVEQADASKPAESAEPTNITPC